MHQCPDLKAHGVFLGAAVTSVLQTSVRGRNSTAALQPLRVSEKSTSAAQPRSTGGAPARLGAVRKAQKQPLMRTIRATWRSRLRCHTEHLGLKQTHPFVALQSLGFHPVDEISEEIAAVLSFAEATGSAGLAASLSVLFLRLSKWNRLQAAAVRLALLLKSLLVFISWAPNSSCDDFPLGLGCFSAWTFL